MAKSTLSEVSDSDLILSLSEKKNDLFTFRFQHATGQLDNTSLLSKTKKEIARIETEIRIREIRAAEQLEAGGNS